jgi:predicted site-specific integrase-resolvase
METVIQEIGLMIKKKDKEYMFMLKLMKNMKVNGIMV